MSNVTRRLGVEYRNDPYTGREPVFSQEWTVTRNSIMVHLHLGKRTALTVKNFVGGQSMYSQFTERTHSSGELVTLFGRLAGVELRELEQAYRHMYGEEERNCPWCNAEPEHLQAIEAVDSDPYSLLTWWQCVGCGEVVAEHEACPQLEAEEPKDYEWANGT